MDNNLENPRVASFSEYLNPSEENLVLKLTEAVEDASLDLNFWEETPSPMNPAMGKTDRKGEIGIFDAHKYFNMKMEQGTPKVMDCTKPTSNGAPSVHSEGSLGSQIALLPRIMRNPSQAKQKKRYFVSFGCVRWCSDRGVENGVANVIHKKDEPRKESFRFMSPIAFDGPKVSRTRMSGEVAFEFPVTKQERSAVQKPFEEEKTEGEPRYSIEVFGSTSMRKRGGDYVERNLERKLSMLTWDAIPKTRSQSPHMGITGPFDDNHSDASSDLFEIEDLSRTGVSFSTNRGSEKTSYCMSPVTHHAPSEVSIEWSVVTASAADFCFSSGYNEKMAKTENGEQNEGQKWPGRLLGCKSHKAVSVAETAHVSTDKARFTAEAQPNGRVWRKDFESAPV